MQTRIYAPWEHYPKHLRQHEVTNPITVVEEFFGANIIEGHEEKLKEWRDYVVNDDCFKDDRHGPATLLFTYDLNIRLVEALYLLMLAYLEDRYSRPKVTDVQLEEEKATWSYFPLNLPRSFLREPYKYLRKLFKKFMPQHYRDILGEWLQAALSNEANDETLTAADVVHIYEAQLNIYSVAWLIYQREYVRRQIGDKFATDIGANSHITTEHEDSSVDISAGDGNVKKLANSVNSIFPNLDTDVENADNALLAKVLEVIKQQVEPTQCILYLGNKLKDPTSIYLFVVTTDHEKRQGYELTSIIFESCRTFARVTALFNNIGNIISAVNGGNYFYCNVLLNLNSVFKVTSLDLPIPKPIDQRLVMERAGKYWHHWHGQSMAYLLSAEQYIVDGKYSLAALSMHQCVQNALVALVRSLLGYRLNVPNLSRMLRIAEMYTDDLTAIFAVPRSNDLNIFTVLMKIQNEVTFIDHQQLDALTTNKILLVVKEFLRVT